MLDEFWNAIGGKLADQWGQAARPALVFWLAMTVAWVSSHGGWGRVTDTVDWLAALPVPGQVAVLAALLICVVITGMLVQRLVPGTLRILEGYWPAWLGFLRRSLVARHARRLGEISTRQQELAPRIGSGKADAGERDEFVRLDLARRRLPGTLQLMPTRIGNLLRAAEARPQQKYGLDTVTVWPRLWLTFPDTARTELLGARAALESAVGASVYGILALGMVPWSWWALLGPAVTVIAVWFWAPPRAAVYGDLVEAAVDCHRAALYRQLRWPLPEHPAAEREQGQLLTRYLLRGSDATSPVFTSPEQP